MNIDRGIIYGNLYDKYHTRNPVARMLMGGFLKSLRQLTAQTDLSRVLEVGCGEGLLLQHLAQIHSWNLAVGLDIGYEPLVQASSLGIPSTTFISGSAYALPVPDSAFTLVVACEVLEHLANPELALQEIQRVAAQHVILSVPREPIWRLLNMARGAYWRDWGNTPSHVQHWSSHAFIEMAQQTLDIKAVLRPFPWTMVLAEVK